MEEKFDMAVRVERKKELSTRMKFAEVYTVRASKNNLIYFCIFGWNFCEFEKMILIRYL